MECRYKGDCGGVDVMGSEDQGKYFLGWSPHSPTRITRSRWVGTDPAIRV